MTSRSGEEADMTKKLPPFVELAISVLPAIGNLIVDDEDDKKLIGNISDLVASVLKEQDSTKAEAKVKADPKLEVELRKHLADLAHNELLERNRAKEEKRRQELETLKEGMKQKEAIHRRELEVFRAQIAETGQARQFALKQSQSEKWWIAYINPLLSIIITVGFFAFVWVIAEMPLSVEPDFSGIAAGDTSTAANEAREEAIAKAEEVSASKERVFYVAFGALATAFATVIGFHFGSSSGSKAKTDALPRPTPPAGGGGNGGTVPGDTSPDSGRRPGENSRSQSKSGKALRQRMADIAEIECDKELVWNNAESEAEKYLKPMREPMRKLGHIGTNPIRFNWCASFVHWCARKAGAEIPFQPDGQSATLALVQAWKGWAQGKGYWSDDISKLQRGDIIVFEWFDGDKQLDHIGIVADFKNGVLMTYEGNRKNKTVTGKRALKNVAGVIRI